MASFAHAVRSFHSGALSREEFLAEVDRILEGGRAQAGWLLKTLDEENTRTPLPPDVHSVVKTRLEMAARDSQANGGNGAGAHPDLQGDDPEPSRTRLATRFAEEGLQPVSPAGSADPQLQPTVADSGTPGAAAAGPERISGTGDVLNGRFVLDECIGSGGMSTVYRALDRRRLEANDRNPHVAVKVLNMEFRSHPDSLIALQREAKKSQNLAHPNIVRVYDFDRDGPTVYMTMEYLSGESLAQKLRAPDFKGLPVDEAMHILEGMAGALIFAHESGIVHADFKPANVILTDNGQVKVIDFGIARAFQRPDETYMEATRFDPGSLRALTPTYASPELLEHREADPRDDIYALACITYEMLTGRHPFGRMQATEARDGELQVDRRKNLTRRQWKAIKSALAFEREHRTPTVRRFLSDFRSTHQLSRPVAVSIASAAILAVVLLATLIGFLHFGSQNVSLQQPVAGTDRAGEQHAQPEPARAAPPAPDAAPDTAGKPGAAPAGAKLPDKPAPRKATTPPAPAAPPLTLAAVMPVLDRVPCSAITATVNNRTVAVRGYASDALDVKRLERDLLGLPGAERVSTSLTQVSKEFCGALELYAPYWSGNRPAGDGVSILMQGGNHDLVAGEPLIVEIRTPPDNAHIHVDYYFLDGGVVHMLPNAQTETGRMPASETTVLGEFGDWIISEPFGTEMITVLATPKPLFTAPRAEFESARDYNEAVQAALARMRQQSGGEQIRADFLVINTRPKSMLDRMRGQ
jgi:predicted Ser/Thr protein kinase